MERKWEAIIPPQEDMAALARGKVRRVSSSVPSQCSGEHGCSTVRRSTDFNDFLPARQWPGLSNRTRARSNREL